MSFGSIQFGGLASGLDTNAIISAILSMESRPMQLLEYQKATEKDRISLWGTLEGLVETLQDKANEFTSSSNDLFAHAITAADESIATFTVTGSPASGAHTLLVNSLASADRYAFDGVADADTTDQGSGTVSFSYGGTDYSIDIAAESSTLNEIAAAINTAAGDDVTATVVNAGTVDSPSYQLVLAGNDTGEDNAIVGLTSTVAGVVNATNIATASNAEIVIDGLTVERSTNVFSDVIEGISFTVQGTNTTATTFSAEVDVEGTKEKFQEFIDAYNAVIEFVNAQNSYDDEGGPGGNLFGDYGLGRVAQTIRSELFDVPIDAANGYSSLGLIGIDLGSDGTLSIDEGEFEEKMMADMDSFASFFTDSEGGILIGLDSAIDGLLKGGENDDGSTYESFFNTKEESLNSIVKSLDTRIEHMEYNLEKLEERLVMQYANLESVMSGLNSQMSYLSQALAASNS